MRSSISLRDWQRGWINRRVKRGRFRFRRKLRESEPIEVLSSYSSPR
jgi:hypothetical protein